MMDLMFDYDEWDLVDGMVVMMGVLLVDYNWCVSGEFEVVWNKLLVMGLVEGKEDSM